MEELVGALKSEIIKHRLAGELAEKIGVHRRTLYSWLDGFCQKMPLSAVVIIAAHPKLDESMKEVLLGQLGIICPSKARDSVCLLVGGGPEAYRPPLQLKGLLAEDPEGQVFVVSPPK